jgi:hypothetical protein
MAALASADPQDHRSRGVVLLLAGFVGLWW